MAFPTTRWTLIRQAIATPSEGSRAALEELCQRYAPVVLGFVRRRCGPQENAEDLTQEFFARLLDGDLLSRASADLGQFRSFLMHAVRNFMSDARDYSGAQKRGGHVQRISLSGDGVPEPQTELTPEREFEVLWGRTILRQALGRLEQEYQDARRGEIFESLKGLLDGSRPMSGDELARQLGMSAGAVRVTLHRMRQRLGDLIRAEVAETVPDSNDVDEELVRLRQALEKTA